MDTGGINQETIVYVLVEAHDPGTAKRRAKRTMNGVVEAVSRPVESFVDFQMFQGDDVERFTEIWGAKPSAAAVTTPEGEELLEEAKEKTEHEFRRNLKIVENLLESYSAEELMANEENARLYFLKLGATIGPSVPIYAESGVPLRDEREITRFLETHGEVWIVPVVAVY